jgi:LysM repeat protein
MIQVRAGDTLFGLARRHGVGVNELMAANNLPNARIEVGQVLLLPNR